MTPLTVRTADRADIPTIFAFVNELAAFEKAEHEVRATEADLERTLFGDAPAARALIADVDGTPAGMAVWFFNYSTWLGRKGLYLEDLYVTPTARGAGVGRALLARLASIAVTNDCPRFEWSVLDWNAPAIGVYEALGAVRKHEWVGYRLEGEALERLAADNGDATARGAFPTPS